MNWIREIPTRLWLFLFGIHTVYFLIAYFFGNIYTVDSYGYLQQASNLWNHHSWYAEDWQAPVQLDYFSFRPPLYACFIICCKVLSQSNYFILILQNFISIGNLILLYKVYERCGLNQKHSAIALIIVFSCYPAQFIHTNLVMTEMIFQSLLLWLFYFILQFVQSVKTKNVWPIALLLSVALLTKPVIILFSVALFLMVCYYAYQEKKWHIIYPFILVPLIFHFICLQNQHSTGYYHFSSVKPLFHLKYNAKYTLLAKFGENYADSTISAVMKQADGSIDYASRYETMQLRGNEIIMKYPVYYAKIFAKGCMAFFIDPGRYDLFHLFGVNDNGFNGLYHEFNVYGFSALRKFIQQAPSGLLLLLLMNLCWNILVTICFVWFMFYRKAPILLRMLVFIFVAYIALATGVLGLSRYRVPIYPELSVAVMYAYQRFYLSRKYV